MPDTTTPEAYRHLDAIDLADTLGISLRAVVFRARHRPSRLPPCAQLYDRELLRWRADVVGSWVTGTQF